MSICSYGFVFPGQGSQSLGMLAELAQAYPLVQALFDEVSDELGYDVWQLVQMGPLSQLNETEYTQVVMLVADVVVFRLVQKGGLNPVALAGHSLGEYAALVCADAIHLRDAARLVQARGRLMQEAVPLGQGAMAAVVGLSDAVVLELCQQVSTTSERVMPANYNAIGQVVVAGHSLAVERLIAVAAEQADTRLARVIPVSVPCHCDLLQPAASVFKDLLQQAPFSLPRWPVLSNVNVLPYDSVAGIRSLLSQQLYAPVRWVETIQTIKKRGGTFIIECGPGKVLAGLIKRIDKSIETLSVNDIESLNAAQCILHPEWVEDIEKDD